MMARTQIALDNEIQRQAHRRASELGISFAEYVRTLVRRDLARPVADANVACIFDLGSSGVSNGVSDIARNKASMIAEAFQSAHRDSRQGQDLTAA
jgi:hypothetical protein